MEVVMHVHVCLAAVLALAPLVGCSAGPSPARADSARAGSRSPGTAPATALASGRATTGDTVLIAVNHVRADRRAQFEEFAQKFWEAGTRAGALDSVQTATFRYTRTLYPTAPDSDGTFAYLFIMDPAIRGGNYDIGALLKQLFPADEASRLGRMLEESMARPQDLMKVVQMLPR
jgi:hypothetical protein